jgi:flagellar hook-basal body complex protein FliE
MQITGVSGVPAGWARPADPGQSTVARTALPFGQLVQHLLEQASTHFAQANQSVQELALGRTENLHDVLLSVAQADLTFRMILEIRNRLTEAYQEIVRMQV